MELKTDGDVRTAVGIIQYQVDALTSSSERIEKRLEALSVVSKEDFKAFTDAVNQRFLEQDRKIEVNAKEAETAYVKKSSFKGAQAVGWAVLTALAVSGTIAAVKLLGPAL